MCIFATCCMQVLAPPATPDLQQTVSGQELAVRRVMCAVRLSLSPTLSLLSILLPLPGGLGAERRSHHTAGK